MMASSTAVFSLSLSAFSSLTSINSQRRILIFSCKSHEKIALSSSLLGSKICVNEATRSKPMNMRNSRVTCSASSTALPSALLFDCDGVLVDTEKDGHRISFNDTFNEVFTLLLLLLCFSVLLDYVLGIWEVFKHFEVGLSLIESIVCLLRKY